MSLASRGRFEPDFKDKMNREMRRLMEREERRQKKQESSGGAQKRAQTLTRQQGERKPVPQRLRDFFHDVRQEMKKVSWPTQEQMVAFTSVTLLTTVILTLVIFAFDAGMKELVIQVVQRQ